MDSDAVIDVLERLDLIGRLLEASEEVATEHAHTLGGWISDLATAGLHALDVDASLVTVTSEPSPMS